MRLFRQLHLTQIKQRHNLSGQLLSCGESLRIEHNSRNHFFIRLCHGHLSEQLFEVVRQLGATGVVRVHRDEDAHLHVQFDVAAHQVDPVSLFAETDLDCQDLLTDCREHTLF